MGAGVEVDVGVQGALGRCEGGMGGWCVVGCGIGMGLGSGVRSGSSEGGGPGRIPWLARGPPKPGLAASTYI